MTKVADDEVTEVFEDYVWKWSRLWACHDMWDQK